MKPRQKCMGPWNRRKLRHFLVRAELDKTTACTPVRGGESLGYPGLRGWLQHCPEAAKTVQATSSAAGTKVWLLECGFALRVEERRLGHYTA